MHVRPNKKMGLPRAHWFAESRVRMGIWPEIGVVEVFTPYAPAVQTPALRATINALIAVENLSRFTEDRGEFIGPVRTEETLVISVLRDCFDPYSPPVFGIRTV